MKKQLLLTGFLIAGFIVLSAIVIYTGASIKAPGSNTELTNQTPTQHYEMPRLIPTAWFH